MGNKVFELTIKNDKRIIPEIAIFVSDSAFKLGLSKRKSNFLCFVIETALEYRVNDVKDDESSIIIRAIDTGRMFKFEITDLGAPYILTNSQQAILKRKLVDRYSFEQKGRKGQTFSFAYKYDGDVNIKLIESAKEELLDENFTFRRLKNNDEDVLRAIKCLYDVYGYEYYHQHLYSVLTFRRYLSGGTYVPIISENEHKQVMAYCALDENLWFKGVPEFSNLVTKEIARGKGLATNIFKKTEEIASEMGYEGIHVSAVAYHPYTQKMCNKLGYTPSAIEYSINPKGTGGYDSDRRLDCVIGLKIFNKTKKHDLYLDQECNNLFKMIFDEEKLNYEIHNDLINLDDKDNEVAYFVDTDTSNTFFKIDECGKDVEEYLKAVLAKEEVDSSDVITINLNITSDSSIAGYKALRKLGFICVGTIAGSINGDYMLLQKFKEEPSFEKIVLEDNYTRLKEEIYKLNNIEIKK